MKWAGRRTGENRRATRSGGPVGDVPAPPAWMRWLPLFYIVVVLALEPLTPVQWPVSFVLIALPVIAAFA